LRARAGGFRFEAMCFFRVTSLAQRTFCVKNWKNYARVFVNAFTQENFSIR